MADHDVGALCAFPGGDTFSRIWIEVLCDFLRLACDRRLATPRTEAVIRFYAEDIALCGSTQSVLVLTDPIHGVRRGPRERNVGRQRRLDHLNGQSRFGGEVYCLRKNGLWQVARDQSSSSWPDTMCDR